MDWTGSDSKQRWFVLESHPQVQRQVPHPSGSHSPPVHLLLGLNCSHCRDELLSLKYIVLPPLLAGRKEENCAPVPDKIEINSWEFSQHADLSSLPLNLSWMEALCPFRFCILHLPALSMQRFKAANSSQKFFLALCFPSAVCFPLHATDAHRSPSRGEQPYKPCSTSS